MWNAGLDEAQAGVKIAGRNISNLRYVDDTTLMVENEEDLKSLFQSKNVFYDWYTEKDLLPRTRYVSGKSFQVTFKIT